MGEQKRKSNWWKWAAGAAAFGAAVFLGVKAFGGSNNTQTAGVSVTPTVLIAEASSTPEQMVTVTPEPSPTPRTALPIPGTGMDISSFCARSCPF